MGSFGKCPPIPALKQMSDELAGRIPEILPLAEMVEDFFTKFRNSLNLRSRCCAVHIPIECEVERLAEGIFYGEIRERYRKDQEEGLCKLTREVLGSATIIIKLEW